MTKKAIILDLDNTIYPAPAISEKLFGPLFKLIQESGELDGEFEELKKQMMRRPFQAVANDFSLSEELQSKCIELLSDLTYDDKMDAFDDYESVRNLPLKKYLVTTGFSKLQYSKIKQLNIEKDFEEVFVVDPNKSELTKKDIFMQILSDNGFQPKEVIVVGDDIDSEIKAGKELGIDTVLYNHNGEQEEVNDENSIRSFKEITSYLG